MTYANCCDVTTVECCGVTLRGRRYYTRAERREWLEGYAGQLESELAAVRERIQALAEEE